MNAASFFSNTRKCAQYAIEGKQESSMMGMVVLAESLNVNDTQRCSQHNNMLSGSESECFRS
eukprot:scaffold30411_cov32-Attheya_sp.AAC.1